MEKYFTLTVAKGSIIHASKGKSRVIDELPEEAEQLWQEGDSTLVLKKSGEELLKGYSKSKLEKILAARTSLGYTAELELLEKALKKVSQTVKDKPEKPISS